MNNLLAAVEAGDLEASIELLKCCNIYGDGSMNAIHDRGPEGNLQYLIDQRIAAEGIPKTEHDTMAGMLDMPTTAYRVREQAIRAELAAEYLEPDA